MPTRLDALLVQQGLARSRDQAKQLIAAGRVTVDGKPASKPSQPATPDAAILVAPHPGDDGYASRAAHKLIGALDALPAVAALINGATCLDLGASTGGFTDVLLRRGASRVIALDVGHDQLIDRLRADQRVTVIEGFNVRGLTRAGLTDLAGLADLPDCPNSQPALIVADLSFISLTLIVGPVAAAMPPAGQALLLVKPQFEVGRDRLGSGGVVRDPELRKQAILTVIDAAANAGLTCMNVLPSLLPGPSGNREFFIHLSRHGTPGNVTDQVEQAVAWEPSAVSSMQQETGGVQTP
ncbi:MAG: TlyA family RNA methyltransferase [Cellulomonadaceae bacterium]|jgi:23S rRNA (cytidine1920-2'-O)/16S rRNA (cytidine1409-2'-O)-methyltransferase|nr:TlyA family RNA methyltransferase [Cellulomonadaceae bacterium]